MTQVYLHPATPATASPQSAAPHRTARQSLAAAFFLPVFGIQH
jgi:hypothetical protein